MGIIWELKAVALVAVRTHSHKTNANKITAKYCHKTVANSKLKFRV